MIRRSGCTKVIWGVTSNSWTFASTHSKPTFYLKTVWKITSHPVTSISLECHVKLTNPPTSAVMGENSHYPKRTSTYSQVLHTGIQRNHLRTTLLKKLHLKSSAEKKCSSIRMDIARSVQSLWKCMNHPVFETYRKRSGQKRIQNNCGSSGLYVQAAKFTREIFGLLLKNVWLLFFLWLWTGFLHAPRDISSKPGQEILYTI